MKTTVYDGKRFLYSSKGIPWHINDYAGYGTYTCGICGDTYNVNNNWMHHHDGHCTGRTCAWCQQHVWMIYSHTCGEFTLCDTCHTTRKELLKNSPDIIACELCDVRISTERLMLAQSGVVDPVILGVCPGCFTTLRTKPTFNKLPLYKRVKVWHILVALPSIGTAVMWMWM